MFAILSPVSCVTGVRSVAMATHERKGIMIVNGTINGFGPYCAFIDTGADPSVVDLSTAREIGLPVDESSTGEAEGSGDGKGLTVIEASIQGPSLNGPKIEPTEAFAADLSAFSTALDTDLALILGYSFLKNRIVRFDDQANEMAHRYSNKKKRNGPNP